jgi:hypothetical protein
MKDDPAFFKNYLESKPLLAKKILTGSSSLMVLKSSPSDDMNSGSQYSV